MSNELIFNNYLLILKSSTEVYVHGTLEAKTKKIRELLNSCLDTILLNQGKTYDLMTEYNWYTVENIDSTKVDEMLNKLEK